MVRSFLLSSSSNVGEHFATHLLIPGLLAGQHTLGCAQNRHSQATQHARNLIHGHVLAQARLADTLDAGDDALAGLELQINLKFLFASPLTE